MMTREEITASTAICPEAIQQNERAISHVTLGLLCEAGEIPSKYTKVLRGDIPLEEAKSALVNELGDVLWHLTRLAAELGFSLEELQKANVTKLLSCKKRRPSGEWRYQIDQSSREAFS